MRFGSIFRRLRIGGFLRVDRPSTRLEIMTGRVLAVCVHPFMAWRVLSPSGRALILTSYAVTTYITVLTMLLLLSPSAPRPF